MINVQDLVKNYGPVEALKGVSFHVAPGEIIGLLGPNGAGKTTIMKILTGYLQPTGGTVSVDGLDVVDDAFEVQKRIGYLPENAPLYPELSIQSYLQMMAGWEKRRWTCSCPEGQLTGRESPKRFRRSKCLPHSRHSYS